MTNPHRAKTAEQIKVIVAGMLERRIKDPRLGFVTVTDVRLTGDGREATVFYTVLGDAEPRRRWRLPRPPGCCAPRSASNWA
jgi:ribosome-binding factor A